MTPFKCGVCGKECISKAVLKIHETIHDDNKPESRLRRCKHCSKFFATQSRLEDHERTVHVGAKPFFCKHCDKSFDSRTIHLGEHTIVLTEGKKKYYQCGICLKGKYRFTSQLNAHLSKHTGEMAFECKQCGKTFGTRSGLQSHVVHTHSEDKPYQCFICNKAFKTKINLRHHETVHTGVKAFQCKLCPKAYSQNAHLYTHMKSVHSNIRPFSCDVCGKGFVEKARLKTHMRVHTGEKPLECKHCGKSYSTRNGLVVHERVHTGERPYHCQYCDKTFRCSKSKGEHEKVHTGEKSHQCGICSKVFRQHNHLKGHLKTHQADKIFQCHLCPEAFTSKETRRKHSIRCQLQARAALMDDGMSEEEALLAVEPPLTLSGDYELEEGENSSDDENNNPFKLKKCTIHLRKLWYIEQAIKLGCPTVWIPPKGSNRNLYKPKPIF